MELGGTLALQVDILEPDGLRSADESGLPNDCRSRGIGSDGRQWSKVHLVDIENVSDLLDVVSRVRDQARDSCRNLSRRRCGAVSCDDCPTRIVECQCPCFVFLRIVRVGEGDFPHCETSARNGDVVARATTRHDDREGRGEFTRSFLNDN